MSLKREKHRAVQKRAGKSAAENVGGVTPRRETAGIWAGRLATAFAARFRAVDPQKTSYSL